MTFPAENATPLTFSPDVVVIPQVDVLMLEIAAKAVAKVVVKLPVPQVPSMI